MPFTPFHLGPALLFGLLAYRWFDLPAVLAASVLVDVRAALVLFGYLDGPIHGPLHTLVGAGVVGLVVAGVWTVLRDRFQPVLAALRLRRERSTRAIVAGAVASAWLHVLLDALLYPDVALLAPLSAANPLPWPAGTLLASAGVYLGCVVAGVLGLALYLASVALPDRGVGLDAR